MAEPLAGRRILVVEDEYMLASDLAHYLEARGASVVGPAGTILGALALTEADRLDAAVLDVNLRNEPVYPVADALLARGVAVVFATGYEELVMGRRYIGLPRCSKPVDKEMLLRLLLQAMAARGAV